MELGGCVVVQILQTVEFHETVNAVNGFLTGIHILRVEGKILHSSRHKGKEMGIHAELAVPVGLFLLTGNSIGLNQDRFPLEGVVLRFQYLFQWVDHLLGPAAVQINTGF